MATTKTIQATIKNRTDTAANWTQKNPVLAEGEIIVVQTSAGETRLKIGDGVKTFTQLPYTDEQIYNNVVTSVNGQTGDITMNSVYQYAVESGYTGTEAEFAKKLTSEALTVHVTDNNGTLSADKSFIEIRDTIIAGIPVYVDYDGNVLPPTSLSANALYFGTTMCVNDGTASAAASIMIEISQSDEVQDISAEILGAQEPLIGTTGTLTPTQVHDAMSEGIPVKVQYFDDTFGWLSYTNFNIAENVNMIVANSISIYYNAYILSELYGDTTNNTWGFTTTTLAEKADIPKTLPNPNAITFTGAVNATYDGSTAVSVEIPSGGTDISLGLASAAVGQTIKVKAIDSNGIPTEWEAATFSGSSSDYVINVTLDTLQSSIGNWVLGYSCTCDKTYAEVLAAYQSGAKVLAHVTRNKEITLSDGSKRTIPIINEAPLTRYIAAQNLLVFDYVHNATDFSVSSGGLTYTTGDSGDSMICYVATYQFAFGAADTSADSVQIPTTTKVQDMIETSVRDINTNTYTIQVSNTAPAAGTSDKIITYVVEDTVAESKNSPLEQ